MQSSAVTFVTTRYTGRGEMLSSKTAVLGRPPSRRLLVVGDTGDSGSERTRAVCSLRYLPLNKLSHLMRKYDVLGI